MGFDFFSGPPSQGAFPSIFPMIYHRRGIPRPFHRPIPPVPRHPRRYARYNSRKHPSHAGHVPGRRWFNNGCATLWCRQKRSSGYQKTPYQ